MASYSICALTLYRIYSTTTLSSSNSQSDYAVIALLTSLEALLGIINACLPVLKPIYNRMRGTAPKNGNNADVNEILKSGTIPIFMRISQMFTLTSKKGNNFSSDGETLAETSGWYEEMKKTGKDSEHGAQNGKEPSVTTRAISSPMTEKAERLMGFKRQEIHVRRDVDVESAVNRDDNRFAGEGWERR